MNYHEVIQKIEVAVVEWLHLWLVKQGVQGTNPGLATSISETWLPGISSFQHVQVAIWLKYY